MNRGTARIAIGVFLGTVLLLVSLKGSTSAAQQPPVPAAGGARFTGKQQMLEAASSETLRAARGRFEAGTRSYWHSHETGQLIFVQEGRARLQRKGEPIKDLKAHESDFTEANVLHWHGAAPDQAAVLTTVAFGGSTKWLDEEVTDAQYRGK